MNYQLAAICTFITISLTSMDIEKEDLIKEFDDVIFDAFFFDNNTEKRCNNGVIKEDFIHITMLFHEQNKEWAYLHKSLGKYAFLKSGHIQVDVDQEKAKLLFEYFKSQYDGTQLMQ